MENKWSDLCIDVLIHIFKSLTIPDVFYFSAVCTSWRLAAAASNYRPRLRHQSPWLMFVDKEDPNSAQLFSLVNNKVYRIPNQPDLAIANRVFIGSAHGWLITADERSELSLLNPITCQQIELPPVSSFEHVTTLHDGYLLNNLYYTADDLRHALFHKATLSSSLATGDFVVALILCEPSIIAFAQVGDKKWTVIDNDHFRNDITFLDDGKLYTTDWGGSVEAWDLSTKDPNSIQRELVIHNAPISDNAKISDNMDYNIDSFFYLVRAPSGELLLVRRDIYFEDASGVTTLRIKIWKIELDKLK